MGGNLTVFNKDYNTREKLIVNSFKSFKSKVLTAKHRHSLQLLYIVGGNQARLDARSEFEISPKGGWKLVVHRAVTFLKKKNWFFSGGLLQYSVSIAILTRFGGVC